MMVITPKHVGADLLSVLM